MDAQNVFLRIVAQRSWRRFTVRAVQARLLRLGCSLLHLLDEDLESTRLIQEVDLDIWGQAGSFKGEGEIALEILRELVLSSDGFGAGIEQNER